MAVIPGDGVGIEVIRAGLVVLLAAADADGSFRLETTELPWSCQWYLRHGSMMPADGLDILAEHEAIYLGAIGAPAVPDHVSVWGLILPIRQAFDQYVNLRPIRALHGVQSPLRQVTPETLDILCVRENTEGEYAGVGGRLHAGSQDELAIQSSVFSRRGIARVARYAFDRASERRLHVASATKSNALQYSAVLWDEVVAEVAADYPPVKLSSYHVDALAARFVTAPDSLDVVVASNLYGDILTDLGAALQGSLGVAASANLNPERRYPSMFEPIHGSAPDIAGTGVANPIAAIWAGAMMLEFLGEARASTAVMQAMEEVTVSGLKTADVGGHLTTAAVAAAVAERLRTL